MAPSRISRRAFLRFAAIGAAGAAFFRGCTPWRAGGDAAFSDNDRRLLGAIADCLIPPDAAPGGRANGVVVFIERQLAGPYRRYAADYRRGLDAITRTCLARSSVRFEGLSAADQQALLREMEAGTLQEEEWRGGFAQGFFELLRSHAMQGFYGSPRHGGNPGYASYPMMGIEYPPIRGQNRYRS